ncbi:putative agmatine deiminase [Tetrabaena socialis]|uniref:Putative agmatine deiminase n=1 Tax=Tetrabaena socialis TaxID=47790 RepID=A0A2J8AKC6_9CHLO|nr:putative agmatine deiminase [Tetrabaena socialis]|eukprot:PNH12974.1 putative agmatine deiminase [Tetrabaena socialis]
MGCVCVCVVRDGSGGRREVAAVSWDYNCYGSPAKLAAGQPVLMADWSLDRAAGRSLPARAGLRVFECPLVLEGGAIHSDGQGTLLVTEECLLHPSRNPGLGKEGIEALLRDFLGVDRVLWLWKGLVGDEEGTNGHVDNMAAFAEPGTVLLAWSDDPNDPLHEYDAAGRCLRVIKVPSPSPPLFMTYREANCDRAAASLFAGTAVPVGWRLAGSYLNHYVVNGGVVVPHTLLVTEECLLHPSRNPGLGKEGIEALLRDFLGVERVLWLWKGMVGDEEGTNGHVDNMAAFAEPGTVLLAWSDDPNDPLHEAAGQYDAAGRRLRVIKVPSPSPPLFMTYREANCDRAAASLFAGTAVPVGWRLAGSYLNHYVVNGGVVVPQFGGAQSRSDEEALRALAAAYPGRQVVGVQSREVLLGGGNIHCFTQQLPAGAGADAQAQP